MQKKLIGLALAGTLSVPMLAAEFITIGTGGVTGTYYPTGGAICQMVNKNKKEDQYPLFRRIHRRIGL